MKIITLEQGSKDWLNWRLAGVGASESPCLLMEKHPWMTPYKLYCLKLGLVQPDPPNWAMKQGIIKEPHVRDWFSKNYFPIEPVCAEMDEYPYIKASLDGWNSNADSIVEIKVTGKANHDLARKGGIPEKYRIQVQHQLLVSGASKCYYVSYLNTEGDYAVVEELPDEQYQEQIFNACKGFWARVQTRDMPTPGPSDEIIGDNQFNAFVERYLDLDRTAKEANKEKARLKEALVEQYSHEKVRGERARVFKRAQPGRYDYSKLVDAAKNAGVDVDSFKGEDSYHWVIQEIKGEK